MMRGVPGMDYDIEKLKMTIEDHNGIATSLQLQKEGFSCLMLYDSKLLHVEQMVDVYKAVFVSLNK